MEKKMSNSARYTQILIVEDDSIIRELMKRIVEVEDHWQPTAVNCGAHAVEAWDNGHFDVILMDLKMPGMDGFDTTKQIREHERLSGRKHTPIIAFTALIGEDTHQRCIAAGMDDYALKPSSVKEVIDMIYKHLPD
jgi:CheY-like chemotaxis protein